MSQLKTALVADWLTNLGGAEKVVATVAEIFPDAPIFTTFANFERIRPLFPDPARIRPSIFNKIPLIARRQIFIAPWLRTAVERMDLHDFDLILSFSSSVAKNIRTRPGQIHICYCHTPARYIWQRDDDPRFERFPAIFKPAIDAYLDRLKKWDEAGSKSVDFFIANSTETATRIEKFYHRSSEILYPPVDLEKFKITKKSDYFFSFGRFVKYKKFDLLVKTFQKIPDQKLILAGDGPERIFCEKLAKNAKNIEFCGKISDSKLQNLLGAARAMILPQKEDAGIAQLEAFASGTPVIAFRAGGALDVLRDGKNGLFFDEQTPESVCIAIKTFERVEKKFDAIKIRETAREFSRQNFQKKYKNLVKNLQNSKFGEIENLPKKSN